MNLCTNCSTGILLSNWANSVGRKTAKIQSEQIHNFDVDKLSLNHHVACGVKTARKPLKYPFCNIVNNDVTMLLCSLSRSSWRIHLSRLPDNIPESSSAACNESRYSRISLIFPSWITNDPTIGTVVVAASGCSYALNAPFQHGTFVFSGYHAKSEALGSWLIQLNRFHKEGDKRLAGGPYTDSGRSPCRDHVASSAKRRPIFSRSPANRASRIRSRAHHDRMPGTGARTDPASAPGRTYVRRPVPGPRRRFPSSPSRCPRRNGARGCRPANQLSAPTSPHSRKVPYQAVALRFATAADGKCP